MVRRDICSKGVRLPHAYPNYGRIDGPIVIIGFGSIGQGTLPLIERHFTYDPHQVYVIEPSDEHKTFLDSGASISSITR